MQIFVSRDGQQFGPYPVREGTVFLGEQATPIIEALGPKLDEPINWEEILAAIQSSGLEPDA